MLWQCGAIWAVIWACGTWCSGDFKGGEIIPWRNFPWQNCPLAKVSLARLSPGESFPPPVFDPRYVPQVVCWAPYMFVVGPHRIRWYRPMACACRCLGGGGAGEPLFVLILRELSGKLAWLSVALKTSVRLLMMRAHLFLLRAFVTAEDFRLPETMSVFLRALGELQPGGWANLMHVSTSPKPALQALDPAVAARG